MPDKTPMQAAAEVYELMYYADAEDVVVHVRGPDIVIEITSTSGKGTLTLNRKTWHEVIRWYVGGASDGKLEVGDDKNG